MEYKIEFQKSYQSKHRKTTIYIIEYKNTPYALKCIVEPACCLGAKLRYGWSCDEFYLNLYDKDITINQAFESFIYGEYVEDEHWNHP